jgi:RHS repeat-associated protein
MGCVKLDIPVKNQQPLGVIHRALEVSEKKNLNYTPFGVQFNTQLYSTAKQNYEYQAHESQSDHGLRRIMMGARCLNPTIGRFDGVDNFASAAPGWSSYRFAFNNPVIYTDPDGNFETSMFNSSTTVDVSGGSFNNGFRDVSFAAAAYSVGYFDFSGGASGEYRQRAGSEETGRIFNYRGDPNNVKVLYDDYWEWVPGDGPAFSQALPGINQIRFQSIFAASPSKYISIGLGATNTLTGFKGDATYSKYHWVQRNGRLRWTSEITRSNYVVNRSNSLVKAATKNARLISKATGGVGLLVSGYQFANDPTYANGLDVIMGATTFIPVVGWAISGTYFISNALIEVSTGSSIGEHVFGNKRVF